MTIGNRVTFGEPEDITASAEDGQSIRLPVSVAVSGVSRSRGEPGPATEHEVIVRLSGDRARSWGLDRDRARAVMLHAAVEHVFEVARRRDFKRSEEVRIDAGTFPGPMPVRFDRPISVSGSTIEIERAGKADGLAPRLT